MKRSLILDQDEVYNMIRLAGVNRRDRALIAFLYIFGCRRGEAIQIRKRDITFEDGYMVTNLPVEKRGEEFHHRVKVNTSTPFLNEILSYLERLTPDDRLFPLTGRHILRLVRKYDPTVHTHLFRHTRATKLAEKGATESQLMTWFGWRSAEPTTVYIRRSSKLINNLADRVD